MVGLSMALTIAVCIGGFVWIYAQVEPFTSDFVDAATVAPTRESASSDEDEPEGEETPESDGEDEGGGSGDENADEEPTEEPEPTETPDGFQATHVVSSEVTINFRPGPGVNSGDPVAQLTPGTELQYLDETEASQDPDADGDTSWLRFRTEDGLEGWIRQIDVEPVNAGQ
jgi:hypothetical protein